MAIVIECTSKETNYSKQCVNYFQVWHMGTTTKLPYFKQHYGNKHTTGGNLSGPSLPIITQWIQTAWDAMDPAIITKSFNKYSISNYLDGMEDEVLWAEQYDKSDTDSDEEGDYMYDNMMTHERIQQMFSEDSDDEFLGFE